MPMKNILRFLTVITAIIAILGVVKLTAEALSLGTHKYFDVEN